MESSTNLINMSEYERFKNTLDCDRTKLIYEIICVVYLLTKKGISIDDIQNNKDLFMKLYSEKKFSTIHNNIDDIVNQMNLAINPK